jgi:hypothetical protein
MAFIKIKEKLVNINKSIYNLSNFMIKHKVKEV